MIRNSRVHSVLLTTCMAVVAVATATTSANADFGSDSYVRGNAPPEIDIVRFAADNGDRRFSMSVNVVDLRERGEFDFHYSRGNNDGSSPRTLIIDVRRFDGSTRARFYKCNSDACRHMKCLGLRAIWNSEADNVTVSAPQRCYPSRDLPRMGMFSVWSALGDYPKTVDDPNDHILLTRG